MRAALKWSGARLLRALGLVFALTCGAAAQAQQNVDRYRVTFKTGTADMIANGELEHVNRRTIAQLGQLLGGWPTGPGAGLIFVAPRSSGTDQLLWQRSRAILAAVRNGPPGRSWPIQSDPRLNFIEDVARGTQLSPTPAEQSAVDVRIFQDDRQHRGSCPWRAALRDITLPPVMTPLGPSPTLMIAHDGTLPLTPQGEIRISGPSTDYKVVWELEHGELCSTTTDSDGILIVPALPPTRLHIVSAGAREPRAGELSRAAECAATRGSRHVASVSKGIGDDARIAPQGSVQPTPPAGICSIGIAPLGAL